MISGLAVFNLPAQNFTILDFLKWEIDPESLGKGGSSTADGEGLFSIHNNPAHINQIKSWEFTYQYRPIPMLFVTNEGTYYSLAAAYRLNKESSLGILWKYFGYELGYPEGENQSSLIKPTNNKDFTVGLIYGIKFSEGINAAAVVKYLRSELYGVAATGWAIDLGFNGRNLFPSLTLEWDTPRIPELEIFRSGDEFRGLNWGAALLNAGPHMYYLVPEQKDPIPQRFRLGFAYQMIASSLVGLRTSFDFEKELVHQKGATVDEFYQAWFTGWKGKTLKLATYHVGLEICLGYILDLRFGLRYEPFQNYFNTTMLTFGVGIKLKYFSLQYGKWIDRENISSFYSDSYVVGIRIGEIKF
ncbi:MAG: hypothetical protein Kow0042_09520 [Calditrichia bacterium]